MPRRLPPFVERNHVKGKTYLSFRRNKGPRTRLPDDPTSEEFREAYAALLVSEAPVRAKHSRAKPGTIAALIVSYKASSAYLDELRVTTKASYSTPIEYLRTAHGERTVSGLTKERIEEKILKPFADRPGQRLSVLKLLRILIGHAMSMTPPWLSHDPSKGIKRPKTREIRAWNDVEMAAFERRWPLGTKQRTAYELMLNVGAARSDVHAITWRQFEDGEASYSRSKTGVGVNTDQTARLRAALAAWPRKHVTILNTEYGKPYSVKGFGNFMRDAITAAGLPLDCKPHGLRKTLGRRLADAGATANDIMALLGHKTLAEAQRYTREADRKRAGKRAAAALDAFDVIEGQKTNRDAQTPEVSLGKIKIAKEK